MKELEGKGGRWLGPVAEETVVQAEEKLGVVFPAEYRAFLMQYGAGHIGSLEIYGLGGNPHRVPSLLWLVGDLNESGLKRPGPLVPFVATGDGDYVAILAAPLAGNRTGSVVYWSPRRDDVLDLRPASPSFREWLSAQLG